MTEKLYYADSYLFEFSALVTGCERVGDGFAVTLDRTAFFPEGGGQPADTGRIGAARVKDVREQDGRILHFTDQSLLPGTAVFCRIDGEQRLRRMQNHSGEHVVSGLAHKLYGLENVGFHVGQRCMTLDISGELSREQLKTIERLSNEAVRANLPILCFFPSKEELAELDYRSKKEIDEALRLVEIKGVDLCACCAPHVSRTGEIGLIKILDAERHRGGMRLSVICGMDALEDYGRRQESAGAISRLLSVPKENIVPAVERVLAEQARQKERLATLEAELARRMAADYPETEGNLCVFDAVLGEVALRELVNLLSEKCGGFAAAFSGSDSEGYRYVIGSRHVDLRAMARTINAAIGGRGGGSPEMIQGRTTAAAGEIRKAVEGLAKS